ncbi:unnamed protein product [Rhizophagus irregularis]|nr:unnamed protein product [Rhizophagus irregularis]
MMRILLPKEAPKKSSTSTPLSTEKVSSQVKSSWNLHGGAILRTKILLQMKKWPSISGTLKTNTVLQYDDENEEVVSWGYSALVKQPNEKKKNRKETKPVELFKLHLGDLSEDLKPKLPKGVGCEKFIEKTIETCFKGIDFHKHVLFVLTVPTEYLEKDKDIMRNCAFNAGLENLQFTTEPEAAAIYCYTKSTFMIVDCGGGYNRYNHSQVNWKQSISAINPFRDECYGQFQYMIQKFCQHVKLPFTGDLKFSYELDIEEVAPNLKRYIQNEIKDEWKKMNEECPTMILVGGFSESKYLQKRIREEFQHRVKNISVSNQPIAATLRGATILKYTHGIKVRNYWMEGDPIEKKTRNGRIDRFHRLS